MIRNNYNHFPDTTSSLHTAAPEAKHIQNERESHNRSVL